MALPKLERSHWVLVGLCAGVAIATALVTALLFNIRERQSEARTPFVPLAQVTEDTTDPAVWGHKFARGA